MKIIIKDALAQQWPAALCIVLAGIVLGILVGYRAPAAQTYLATSSLRIAKPLVTGVDMPCNTGTLAALAKGDDGLKPAPSGLVSDVLPSAVSAEAAGAEVLQIHAVAPSPATAEAMANGVAGNLIAYCRAKTVQSYTAFNTNLQLQIAAKVAELRDLDTRIIPAADLNASRSDLTKQSDALKTQLTTLAAQQGLESATVAAKRTELDALAPAARAAIANDDSIYKALRAQLDKDTIARDAMRSHYVAAYPALKALESRVTTETQDLQSYANVLAAKPLDLDPSYRAAEAVVNQAQAALDDTTSRIAAATAALEPITARLNGNPVPNALSRATQAALVRQRAEVLKAYQAYSDRLTAAYTEEAQIPAAGPVSSAAAAADALRIGLLFAALLGLLTLAAFALVALLVAVLLNTDRRLLTIASITKLYGKPVIATVSRRKPQA